MKALMTSAVVLIAAAAQAHESFAPHHHPHAISWLPSVETVVIAALLLGAAAVAYARSRRG